MKYLVEYSEFLSYTEEIEADTPDEASQKFIESLTNNTIEPNMSEIDCYEITLIGGEYDTTRANKKRGGSNWQTDNKHHKVQ